MDATTENTSLIASSKVTGTDVYNSAGESIGEVHDLMIDKRSGTTSYAVISFGGLLGIGTDYYPIPWKALRYDPRMEGYVADITAPQLEGAPTYEKDAFPEWNRAYEKNIDDFYGADRYTGIMP